MMWLTGSNKARMPRNRVSSFRGYLLKMRRSGNLFAPQWGKRWFSLEGRFLKWYRQEMDISSAGMVDLKFMRGINKMDSMGHNNTFVVSCQDRNLILRAESYTEMTNWIRAIHIQADIARGGSGMCIVSDFNTLPLNSSSSSSKKKISRKSNVSLEAELEINLKKLLVLEQELLEQSGELDISGLNVHVAVPAAAAAAADAHQVALELKTKSDAASSSACDSLLDSWASSADAPGGPSAYKQHADSKSEERRSRTSRMVRRVESNSSIEDISLDHTATAGGRRYQRELRQQQRKLSSEEEEYPTPPQRNEGKSRRRDTSPSEYSEDSASSPAHNISPRRAELDESDEFEFSEGSSLRQSPEVPVRYPGQTVAGGRGGSGRNAGSDMAGRKDAGDSGFYTSKAKYTIFEVESGSDDRTVLASKRTNAWSSPPDSY